MDKLRSKGQNLGRVFNSRSGCTWALLLCFYEAKLPNLNLKTRPKRSSSAMNTVDSFQLYVSDPKLTNKSQNKMAMAIQKTHHFSFIKNQRQNNAIYHNVLNCDNWH